MKTTNYEYVEHELLKRSIDNTKREISRLNSELALMMREKKRRQRLSSTVVLDGMGVEL